MHDKRVQKGNTYAAMVIPAGSYPDSFNGTTQAQTQPSKTRAVTRTSVHSKSYRQVPIYPNRDIPSPEPVPGRRHMDLQTDEFREYLTDKPEENEVGVATDFFLDRPPVPLFTPRMPLKENCKHTQIYDGDYELFDFDKEVEPMLNVLIEKTLDQARMEVLEEHELQIIKDQSEEYQMVRNAELIEAQRFEAAEARIAAEISRRGI